MSLAYHYYCSLKNYITLFCSWSFPWFKVGGQGLYQSRGLQHHLKNGHYAHVHFSSIIEETVPLHKQSVFVSLASGQMQVFLPKSLAHLALLPVCYIGAQVRGNFLTPIHTGLSNQNWALTFSRSALCPARGLGTKGASCFFHLPRAPSLGFQSSQTTQEAFILLWYTVSSWHRLGIFKIVPQRSHSAADAYF